MLVEKLLHEIMLDSPYSIESKEDAYYKTFYLDRENTSYYK
jgi:hypothetical protein